MELFGIGSGAELSACGLYRYRLWREWDARLGRVLWVMLNPSVADANLDDPTIKKCCGFARRWGHGGIEVVNLFGYRATQPKDLYEITDPIGPDNDWVIGEALQKDFPLVVAAWGRHGSLLERSGSVRPRLFAHPRVMCLGETKTSPREPLHPLMLGYNTELRPLTM